MDRTTLAGILRENGVVGAGGAGFPTYAKLADGIDTILLNCAECEPLLSLHRQLLSVHTEEILTAFALIAETLGAEQAIVGIKKEYTAAIEAVTERLGAFPKIRIHELPGSYPMGDEVVLVYEATGRVVCPGGIPAECGVAVFNVETLYNVYQATEENRPVTGKYVSVVGEVEHPVTLHVPIGLSVGEVVAMAGKTTTPDPVYLLGGPMMGNFGSVNQPVTKTTNAVIVLDRQHPLVLKKQSRFTIDLGRAASCCCQCRTCTDLCPRYNLGHPIEPHRFMRASANRDFQDLSPFLDTLFCCSCGLCEMYSCPQGLKPRSMIAAYKGSLQKEGIRAPERAARPVESSREYRKVPERRLSERLGLHNYEVPAPLDDTLRKAGSVRVLFSQHIGAPAQAVVSAGQKVSEGELLAKAADGLSVNIHAPIGGEVRQITDRYVIIG